MELIASFIAGLSISILLGWLLFKRTSAIYASERKDSGYKSPGASPI